MLTKEEVTKKISELVRRNEANEEDVRRIENEFYKADDELQEELKQIDRYQNCRSLSSSQRAFYDERRIEVKRHAIERNDMLEDCKSKLLKEIKENNQEISGLRKLTEEKTAEKKDDR